MNNDAYKSKYLKYKAKYTNLKSNQYGSSFKCNNPNALLLSNVCRKDKKGIYKSMEQCITPCLDKRNLQKKSQKRIVYIIGENHINQVKTKLELDKLKKKYDPIVPLIFGEKGMKYNEYNIIEEDELVSKIGMAIYAYSGICTYTSEPKNRQFYNALSLNLKNKGYLEKHIVPYSSDDWISVGKTNLIMFIIRHFFLPL